MLINSCYINCYYYQGINKNVILIESSTGISLAENMLYILLELASSTYSEYKICIAINRNKRKQLKGQLLIEGIKISSRIRIISKSSFKYYYYLATAKYLFTDTSFPRIYIKKDTQIITNTWHGTPLKMMGRDVQNAVYRMGNVQRNLLETDYFICPNQYKKKIMAKAYMLDNLYEGTVLLEGYPRNSIFFDQDNGENLKVSLGMADKEIFIYMPTWRGDLTARKSEQLLDMTEYYLNGLDKKLKQDQVLFVKMHDLVNNAIDYSRYSHIKPFPHNYNVYKLLNACSALITDYSSVFFDFANTRRKIIIFAYDESQYINERGLYFSLDKLPFPVVKTIDGLVRELNSPKEYDDEQFLKDFCTYDSPRAAERICRHVILGEKVCKEEKLSNNGKANVLIYSGTLIKNGITASLLNLFNIIDLNKRNYFVTFQENRLKREPLRTSKIPEKVFIFPMSSVANTTVMEKIAAIVYFKFNKDNTLLKRYLDRLYKRELKKFFGNSHFDYIIQFTGYDKHIINLFQRFNKTKFIYVHNDMLNEIKTRKNQHLLTLKSAYCNYNKVAVVTEDIIPPTVEISGKRENIVVVNNCHAHKQIMARAEHDLVFDEYTECNISMEELAEILKSGINKFISIGRFSPEKGHIMLMKAFENFNILYPTSCLIIIGGHGKIYKEILKYANNSQAKIIIIKSISNPMPILAKCDLFVLSSFYEGLGLVILEADSLGIPVISTNIPGPRGFMNKYGGYLVDPTEKGIYGGMLAYMAGNVKTMGVNYTEYNKSAESQFENLFHKCKSLFSL